MKEIGNSIAQLAAIIMILVTLAVSTAAVSQWFSADGLTEKSAAAEQSQPLLSSDVR